MDFDGTGNSELLWDQRKGHKLFIELCYHFSFILQSDQPDVINIPMLSLHSRSES